MKLPHSQVSQIEIPDQIMQAFAKGLVAAIAQDAKSNEVLMLAWMNQAALLQTINTCKATYFSRSRNAIWVKGESSGNYQEVVGITFDCDGDAILLQVIQHGPACHTGNMSCFHNEISLSQSKSSSQNS